MQVQSAPVKSKYVDPSLNVLCCGWVKLDENGKCPKCHKMWKREPTFASLRKRLEIIVNLNRPVLERTSLSQFQFDNIIIPIKISGKYYAVPFRVLKDFDHITSHEKQKELFGLIQSTCNVIQFP